MAPRLRPYAIAADGHVHQFFCDNLLHDLDLEITFANQLLQPRIFRLELLQPVWPRSPASHRNVYVTCSRSARCPMPLRQSVSQRGAPLSQTESAKDSDTTACLLSRLGAPKQGFFPPALGIAVSRVSLGNDARRLPLAAAFSLTCPFVLEAGTLGARDAGADASPPTI